MKPVIFNIKKPFPGRPNYVGLRGSEVEKAIRLGAMIDITIPTGRVLMDPNDWKKDCQIMKKPYKFRNNPMILYCNYVPLPGIKGEMITPEKKKKQDLQLTLF